MLFPKVSQYGARKMLFNFPALASQQIEPIVHIVARE
jgi:hypothetical protein